MVGLTLAPWGRPPGGLPASLARLQRTTVMGILNVTPDSFSDGGRYLDAAAALAHAEAMVEAGVDIIDVGGESTRPGAGRVDSAQEQARVLPVIASILELGVPVSIDTMRAATARAAVEAGACLVNDVSGGLADPEMLPAAAALQVPYVVMHWRGHSDRMAQSAHYDDVVTAVSTQLASRVAAALQAGILADHVVVDPGLGFAKGHDDNWALLSGLAAAVPPDVPVLIGASRKRFLGALLADDRFEPRPVQFRDHASAAISALAAAAGVWCVRVHDVAASADAVRVVAAWRAATDEAASSHRGHEPSTGNIHQEEIR